MKATYRIATAIIGLALAAPLAAHHNSPFGEELEIGDAMGMHETAIEALAERGAMDPADGVNSSDGSRINDVIPEPEGIGVAPVGTTPLPGNSDGGNRDGVPWAPE